MKLWEKQSTFAHNVANLINYIDSKGFFVTFGECFRTQEQANIYSQTGKGIADSLHCKRLAVDLNLINAEGIYLPDSADYKQFGKYWESLNDLNKWGGNFKNRIDGNHFEMDDL
jgi:hypothetical protein